MLTAIADCAHCCASPAGRTDLSVCEHCGAVGPMSSGRRQRRVLPLSEELVAAEFPGGRPQPKGWALPYPHTEEFWAAVQALGGKRMGR